MPRKHIILFKLHRWALLLAVLSFLGQLTYGCFTGKLIAAPGSLATSCPLVQEGRTRYQAGQFQEATVAWQQASLTETGFLCRAMAGRGEGKCRHSLDLYKVLLHFPSPVHLALAYQQLGKLTEANQAIQQSLQLIRREADTTDSLRVLAQALNTQGKLELAQGQAEEAIKTWQQAEAAYEKVGDSAGVSRSQINTAQAKQTLGQYREAGETLLKVLGIREQSNLDFSQKITQALKKFPDSSTKVVLLHSLGNVYLSLGDYNSATSFLLSGEKVARDLRLRWAVPTLQGELRWAVPTLQGEVLLSLGNVERAKASRARNVDNVTDALDKANAAIDFYQQALKSDREKVTITQVQAQLNQLSLSLEVDTLVFVLDGALRNIPMAVLYDGEKYLGEKDVAIAVALPKLQFDNRRPSSRLKIFTGGVGEPQTIKDIEFSKIDKLREELEGIANSVPATKPVLNENFTKANLQQQMQAGNFSAIHFKTHGVFSSDPEFTFIVGYKEAIEGKDLAKLIKSSGNIELLVLSACETALGDNRAALGLAGLAVQAGARSTLSTLWKVQDATNTELMLRFYQELAKPGTTKAKALHLAQQALFEKYPAPYFWAPYILVGNWL